MRQEDQEFEVVLGYRVNLRPDWVPGDPSSENKKEYKVKGVLMMRGVSEESSVGDRKNDHPYSEMVKNIAKLSACPRKGWKTMFRGECQITEQLSDEMMVG